MSEGGNLALTDSIAIVVIAGLLSLLPVVALLWVYYVRERKPSVRGSSIAQFFILGMLAVGVAVILERAVYAIWDTTSPATSGAFFAEYTFLNNPRGVALAGLVSFGIIALIEECVRYFLFGELFRRTDDFDQLIDGVQYGFALGLGFAFVENTLYFFQLFRGLDFDTLVVVFFLRFLISTAGHLAFAGVMGYLYARAALSPAERRPLLLRAFLLPWLMHGFFDFLLTVQLSFYTVLLLMFPLALFWLWWGDERLFELHVLHGRRLRFPIAFRKANILWPRMRVVEVLPAMHACPNCYTHLREEETRCVSCGLKLHRRGFPPRFPFILRDEETDVVG
jgi:RsiW-degrading membrane proteinase PrsW (M82 family)